MWWNVPFLKYNSSLKLIQSFVSLIDQEFWLEETISNRRTEMYTLEIHNEINPTCCIFLEIYQWNRRILDWSIKASNCKVHCKSQYDLPSWTDSKNGHWQNAAVSRIITQSVCCNNRTFPLEIFTWNWQRTSESSDWRSNSSNDWQTN